MSNSAGGSKGGKLDVEKKSSFVQIISRLWNDGVGSLETRACIAKLLIEVVAELRRLTPQISEQKVWSSDVQAQFRLIFCAPYAA